MEPIEVRSWGRSGPLVVVLHGGPGAPGSVALLAEALSTEFRVLEPLQRNRDEQPLTVERHIEDLAAAMQTPAALVGWSWGAMLALSFSVAHPDRVRSLVLIGCGTYDRESRAAYQHAMDDRLGSDGRQARDELRSRTKSGSDAERAQASSELGQLIAAAQSVDPISVEDRPQWRTPLASTMRPGAMSNDARMTASNPPPSQRSESQC